MPIEPIGSIPTPPSLIRAAQRFQSKTGIDVLGDMVAGAPTFVSSTRRKRTSSIRWSHIARRDWKAGSTACGLLLSP